MGEIFYEKGKKYNCRVKGIPYFRTSVTINGKRRQVYGNGEKDAMQKKKDLVALADSGVDIDTRNEKLSTIFETWLFDIKRVDKSLKASSFTRYVSTYNTHIKPYAIASMSLLSVSRPVFQSYITSLYEEHGVSNASITNILKVWRMFMGWALNQGYLTKDPTYKVVVPGKYDKKQKKPEFFTEEERAKIVAYMDRTDYFYSVLIKLAFATGMRQGELFALRWSDIHDDYLEVAKSTALVQHTNKDGSTERYREVWDPKSANSQRRIPLLPETSKMLKAHKADQSKYSKKILGKKEVSQYVFTNKNGNIINAATFLESYKTLLRNAGVPYRKFHAIRHTFGTEAIRRGVNVKDLQMLMGHADIATTYIYVHADEESKANAVSLMGSII